jgi:hypothetical protein
MNDVTDPVVAGLGRADLGRLHEHGAGCDGDGASMIARMYGVRSVRYRPGSAGPLAIWPAPGFVDTRLS